MGEDWGAQVDLAQVRLNLVGAAALTREVEEGDGAAGPGAGNATSATAPG